MKDERRQINEDAACSTVLVGEESPLRPAGTTSATASASAAGNAIVDDSIAATEHSADTEPDSGSGETVEEIAGEISVLSGVGFIGC